MFKQWRFKRKLKRLESDEMPTLEKVRELNTIPPFDGIEPSAYEMDYIEMNTRCHSVQQLIQTIQMYLTTLSTMGQLPKNNNVSPNKGVKSLTKYLTDKQGFPYPIRIADEELFSLLGSVVDALEDAGSADETKFTYYLRKIQPFVNEAIEFRMILIKLDSKNK